MPKKTAVAIAVLVLIAVLGLVAVSTLINIEAQTPPAQDTVLHEGKYGIYVLDLATEKVMLLYTTDNEMYTSALGLNTQDRKLVFAQKTGGVNDENTEIYTIDVNGGNLKRLTSNNYFDLYPAWSLDSTRIGFLSKRGGDLDLYRINADGSNNHNITPEYFAASFLCHSPIFSQDDSEIYFSGQWYE